MSARSAREPEDSQRAEVSRIHEPDPAHRAAVVDLAEHLQRASDTGSVYARLVTDVGEVDVPSEVLAILLEAVHNLSRGLAVDVVGRQPVLTTQQAADMLGVSRPTMIRLLENGAIPFERPGKQRRIKLADLIAYRRRMRIADAALDAIVEATEEAGMYDDTDPEEWRVLLKDARKELAEERRRRGEIE